MPNENETETMPPAAVDYALEASPAPQATSRTPSAVSSLLSQAWLPYLIGAAMLVAALVYAFAPTLSGAVGLSLRAAPTVVVFDPVRFLNAQRAAASILAMSPSADLALTMTQVARHAEAVIREEANGALVLVKQSVVLGEDHHDITDAVLQRFGLPTTVPTVTTRLDSAVEQIAPTDSMFSPGRYLEDMILEQDLLSIEQEVQRNELSAHEQVLP